MIARAHTTMVRWAAGLAVGSGVGFLTYALTGSLAAQFVAAGVTGAAIVVGAPWRP